MIIFTAHAVLARSLDAVSLLWLLRLDYIRSLVSDSSIYSRSSSI